MSHKLGYKWQDEGSGRVGSSFFSHVHYFYAAAKGSAPVGKYPSGAKNCAPRVGGDNVAHSGRSDGRKGALLAGNRPHDLIDSERSSLPR